MSTATATQVELPNGQTFTTAPSTKRRALRPSYVERSRKADAPWYMFFATGSLVRVGEFDTRKAAIAYACEMKQTLFGQHYDYAVHDQ